MGGNMIILIPLIAIAIGMCIGEYFLTRAAWPLGIILPAVVFIVAVIIDLILLGLVAILFVIFAVVLLMKYQRDKKQKEIDRMHLDDL